MSPILKLPAELRVQIYQEYALDQSHLDLCLTSHQIKSEYDAEALCTIRIVLNQIKNLYAPQIEFHINNPGNFTSLSTLVLSMPFAPVAPARHAFGQMIDIILTKSLPYVRTIFIDFTSLGDLARVKPYRPLGAETQVIADLCQEMHNSFRSSDRTLNVAVKISARLGMRTLAAMKALDRMLADRNVGMRVMEVWTGSNGLSLAMERGGMVAASWPPCKAGSWRERFFFAEYRNKRLSRWNGWSETPLS